MISEEVQAKVQAKVPPKKALFLALSDDPIIIDEGRKSFQLDKKSGKRCYMLGSRALTIGWGETPQYWVWTALPEFTSGSRFAEVARLNFVWSLEIRGVMNTRDLSPDTNYAAYLVFKIGASAFNNPPVELSVGVGGGEPSTKSVCLDPEPGGRHHSRLVGLPGPVLRSDRWLEIKMGEFFNSHLEDQEVELIVENKDTGNTKREIIVGRIEIRPECIN